MISKLLNYLLSKLVFAVRGLIFLLLAMPSFAADYYWVGGSGTWTSPATHWATSSGGAVFYSSVPSQFDRVIFDANSFTASGQEVTMNSEGFCLEFRSKDVRSGVKFSSTKQLNVYNGFSVDSNLIFNQTGVLNVVAGGFSLGKNVSFTLNGNFNVTAGAFTLLDGATYNQPGGTLTVTNGTFTINVGSSFTHTGGNLYLGNSSLTISPGATFLHQGGITINAGSLTVLTGATYRENSGTLQVNNGNVTIERQSTFYQNGAFNISTGNFNLGSRSTYTQTGGDMNMGNGSFTMGDTITWTKTNSINQNRGDFRIGTDNNFVVVSGNILNDVSGDFYIGARTTFAPNCCTMRTAGHLYFDVTTIINTNSVMQIGVGNLVLDSGMRWTCNNQLNIQNGSLIVKAGASFTQSNQTIIAGSLDLDSAANIAGSTQYYMRGTGTGLYIKSGNRDLKRIQFDGNNGNYTFMDNAIFSNDGIFMYGSGNTINFNAKKINAYRFYSWTGSPITIDLTGTDTIFVKNEFRVYNNSTVIGNPVIYYDGTDNFYFIGLNKTYSKVYMKAQNTGASQIQFQNNSSVNSVEIVAYGTQPLYFDNVTINNYSINYLANVNATVTTQFNNAAHIDTLNITSSYNLKTNLITNGSNYLGRVNIPKLVQWTFQASTTQALVSINPLTGSCGSEFLINSNTPGTAGTIYMATDTLKGNWLKIQDCNATGGAVFTADNTVNFGNVTGWSINAIPPRDFYWIGGTGNWNDANHWSLSSGGSPVGCALPNKSDNVYFDSLSFSASGQSVSVNITADVNNFTVGNIVQGARFISGSELNVYGSLVLNRKMSYELGNNLNFVSADTITKTIFTDSVKLRQVYFGRNTNSTNARWILLDDFNNNDNYLYMQYGKINTNGKSIRTYSFYAWDGGNKAVDWSGTDTVRVQNQFYANTNCTWIGRPNVVKFESTNHFYLYGGSHTFNDIIFNAKNTGDSYIEVQQNITARDININAYGTQWMTLYHQFNIRDFTFRYLTATSRNQGLDFQVNNPTTFRNVKIYGNGLNRPSVYFRYNYTADSVIFSTLNDLYFQNGFTKTIKKYMSVTGACDNRFNFRCDGNNVSLSADTGAVVNVDWVNLQNIKVQGPSATFNATNILNLGGNSGWNLNPYPTTNFYWVGGSGDWSDKNHWSFTSGGTGGVCPVPTQNDNVFFDVNSFSAANQYVNINTSVNCLNMSWNNVNFPRIIGGNDLNIYGSMTLDSKLSWQHNGWTYFRSTNTGNVVTTKGVNMYLVNFIGTGEWTLGDNFRAQYDIYVNAGTFISGGKTITLGRNFYCWTGNQTTVNLTGTDTIFVTNEFRIYPNNFNLTMGNAVVKFTGTSNFTFTGGSKTYSDVVFNADNTGSSTIQIDYNNTIRNLKINAAGYQTVNLSSASTYNDVTMLFRNATNNNPTVNVNGNNTFNDMTITSTGTAGPYIYLNNNNTYNNLIISGVGTRIFIGANQTQTVNDALALGSGGFPVFLQSTSQGTQGTISKPSGNVCMDYIWLRDIRATGGASFNAGATSVNLGNNTNWSFTSCAGYYWVGGAGNWSDYAHHWAYSSGGTIMHNTAPTQNDNVFFDANSFTTAGEVITIDDAQPKMRNLSFASALYNPTIVGTVNSTEMNVYGSLKLISNMNQNFTGTWNFRAANDSNDINTAGKTLTRVNFIGGNSGQGGWVLQNNLTVTDSINHNNGRLRLNGKEVTAQYYISSTSNTRILDLGSSIFNIVDGEWNPSNLTNFTFIKGTSEIILKGSANSNFYGNGLTYNKVTFRPTTTMNSLLTGANTYARLRFEGGVSASLEPVVQNATLFEFSGTCAKQIGIQSTVNGSQATFRQTSGSVVGTFLNLRDNVATGGATFTANQSQNLGNNSGWTYSTAPSISISLTSGLVNCNVNNDGWAKVSVLQGKSPFTYLWSTNETTDSISHLIPGVYTVTVRDSNGCAATDAVSVVNLPSALAAVNWTATAYDICQGTTINFTPNEVSTAMHFDGSNDYIQASHISALNATNLTVEAWVKADSTQADYATIIDKGSDTTSGNGWMLQFNGGNGNVRFWTPNATTVSNTNIKDKQWHHIAASYDGSNYKLYVDGTLENTIPSSNGIVNNSADLFMGNSLMGNMNFAGLIDEVRVWNVARTQSQIQVNRTKDLVGNESGLVAYYNMEYNAGTTTVRDLTSNANNGTLNNMNPSTDWVNPGAVNSTISYLWNFGDFTTSTSKTPSKLFSSPGSYTVSLGTFDKNGCPNYVNKTIRVSQVTYTVVKTNIPCKGTNNGSIVITPAGGIAPYTYSINNGSSYSSNASFTGLAAGNYQVIAKDSIGCTSSVQTFTITQPANVLSYSISQNSPICIGTTAGTINVSASGGTSPYQYSRNAGISYQSASLFDVLGAGNYTIRVRDANNCIASDQSVTITEVDSIKPVFTSCPSNITVNAGSNCTAVVSYSAPTATDNCKTPSVIRTAGLASGSAFSLGTTTVTYLANDSNGNTNTCSFTVTVNDATAPTVLTRNINAQLNGSGVISITASQINNGSFDNCSIDSIKVYPSSFTCANKGNNTVTLWIRDASGNIGTNTATVTVQDVTAPALVCKPDTLVLDGNGNASIASYTELVQSLSDNCGVTQTSISKTNFNASNIGSNTVVLAVQDASNNISSCSTTVVVVEPSPTAICRNKTIYLDNTGNASITAADLDNGSHSSIGISNRSISKSSFNCSNVGANYDTLTVYNAFNRTAYCVATVTVLDTIKPSVVSQNVSVYLDANGAASITANQIDNGSSDICGIASRQVIPSTFTCTNMGVNTVRLKVTDVNGNIDSVSATVTVYDTIKPTVITQNIDVNLDTTGNAVITPSQVSNGSYDNCSIASLTLSKTSFNCSNVGNNVVVLTVEDANGNTSSDTAIVNIIAPNGLPNFSTSKLSYHGSDLSCHGLSDGEITVNASSGTTPYTYSIDSGSNYVSGNVFSGLGANNYLVKVKDHIGCVSSISTVTINQVDQLAGTASSNQPICANTQLTVNASITGGTGVRTYSWIGANNYVSDTTNAGSRVVSNDAIVAMSGNYTVKVTDENNCIYNTSVSVVVNPIPTASISGTTDVCQSLPSPNITFTGANGTAPYTFIYTVNLDYDTVITSSGNVVDVPAPTADYGMFTYSLVSVRDASSSTCLGAASGDASVLVKPMPLFSSDASPVTNTICEGTSTTITCTNAGAGVGSPSYSFLYNNDFNTSIGSAWSFPTSNPATSTPTLKTWNGQSVLGYMGAQQAVLSLTGIPAHDLITIDYDLYIHDSWDGNYSGAGPDVFNMKVDGSSVINTTFANWNYAPYNAQAFPDNIPASHPSTTGNVATNLPTACSGPITTKYHITRIVPHTASSLTLLFEAIGLEVACNESWSIDNLVIQRRTPVPASNITWSTGKVASSITVSPTDTTTYSASNGTCSNFITINVNPTPRANFVIDNPGQCIVGNTFNLTDSSTLAGPGGYTSQWTFAGSNLGTATTKDVTGLNYATFGTKDVSLRVTSVIGNCTNNLGTINKQLDITDTVFVTASNSNPICLGSSVTLNATQNGVLSGTGPAVYSSVYSNNFNSTLDATNWTFPATVPVTSTPGIKSWNGLSVLGYMGAQQAILNLTGIATHDSVKIDYDLYIHDSWDGNNVEAGPDIFNMKVDGSSIIHTTFANWNYAPYNDQAYPGNIPSSHPYFTGAVETQLPKACSGPLSTKYHISKTIAHTASSLSLLLEAVGIEVACNESWSIDNLNIQAGFTSGIISSTGVQWSGGSNASESRIVVSPAVGNTTYTATIGHCSTPYTVTVVPVPTPAFTLDNANCSKTVSFSNTNIENSVSYEWNFGDSTTYAGATAPDHTYSNGTYTITLTATLPSGCVRQTTRTVTIADQPTASFTSASSTSCSNGVLFTNTSTVPTGNTATYLWNFGDGSTSTAVNPTKTYAATSTYDVSLTITTGNACTHTVTQSISATEGVAAAMADFTATVVGACGNKVVTDNLTIGIGNQYLWNFDDGSTSTEFEPVHYYLNGGTRTISLTVVNEQGCASSFNQQVSISNNAGSTGRVGVDFSILPNDTQVLATNKFEFVPSFTNMPNNNPPVYGSGAPTWTFGDSTTSSNTHIYSKVYNAPGNYTVKIVQLTTNTGCYAEASKMVTVLPTPVAVGRDGINRDIRSSIAGASTTGISNVSQNAQFSLYPNPNNGDFKVIVNNLKAKNAEISIVDMLGREVYNHSYKLKGTSDELEIINLNVKSGSYNIIISTGGEVIGRKSFVIVSN